MLSHIYRAVGRACLLYSLNCIIQEIIRSHLPAVDTSEEELNEYLNHSPEYAPVNEITDHPNYHHVPCKIFNTMTRLIKHAGLDQAKVLTNSVQVEDGLPKRLTEKIGEHLKLNIW